jgi:Mg-chelatase subunit ChlD
MMVHGLGQWSIVLTLSGLIAAGSAVASADSLHNAQTPPAVTKPLKETDVSDPVQECALKDATAAEKQTLAQFVVDSSWPRRAIAAMRLERYSCDDSAQMLEKLLGDANWRVRCFAIRSLAARGLQQSETWCAAESEARVVRTLLRYGYAFDHERLTRGIEQHANSSSLSDKLLALEIAVASGDAERVKQAEEWLGTIINRMSRAEAGTFSPRLATLTGAPDYRRPYLWQRWLLKFGKRTDLLQQAQRLRERPAQSSLAALDDDRFASLRDYINAMREKKLDLAILLDCTDSMYSELAEVQGGLDALMLFLGDMQSEVRVGVVAYRDRREKFETLAMDFSSDIASVREKLWKLSTEGGGDSPEAVHPAMQAALKDLSWNREHEKVLILIGDGPPHVGLGSACEAMAANANEQGKLVTHTVQTSGKPVKHFDEIAKAGGGRCVTLEETDSLLIEIAGLTMAERFEREMREFFERYLELCR